MKRQYLPISLLCLAFAGQVFGANLVPNYAIANLVLGQPDFVTSAVPTVHSSFSLRRPEAVVIDPMTRKVFVGDRNNSRVLRYADYASLLNGAGAEAVFGQARFSATSSGSGELNMNRPIGLHFDRLGRLWVADTSNNRVLMYEAASYRNTQPFPDRVFGQPDFVTTTSAASSTKMDTPYGVWIDSQDRLWVADSSNNRVLRFDSISTKASGAAADAVLGQGSFATSTSGVTSSSMDFPESVTVSSSGTLFVADANNNRVLRFANASSLGNGAGASAVLGQVNFTTNTSGLTATTMGATTGVLITSSDTLWVTDRGNKRLLRFDGASTKATGSAANGVVGQPNFTTNTAVVTNRGSIDSYSQPFVDAAGSLWIADTESNRVLRFPADVTKPLLVVTPAVPATITKSKVTIKGTASDAFGISTIQYKIGNGALKTATGTTSWQFKASLVSGKNTITIFAVDSVGNQSISKVIKIKRTSSAAPLSLAAIK